MKGYFNNPKATEEVITRDGWFKSGDLASIDKDGFVYIKDRGDAALAFCLTPKLIYILYA